MKQEVTSATLGQALCAAEAERDKLKSGLGHIQVGNDGTLNRAELFASYLVRANVHAYVHANVRMFMYRARSLFVQRDFVVLRNSISV